MLDLLQLHSEDGENPHCVLIKYFDRFCFNQTRHKERKHFCRVVLQLTRLRRIRKLWELSGEERKWRPVALRQPFGACGYAGSISGGGNNLEMMQERAAIHPLISC